MILEQRSSVSRCGMVKNARTPARREDSLSRERIVELMYGTANGISDRGIDVQIWRLRRVLDEDAQRPRYIQTVRGRGYTFVPDEREEFNEVQ